MSHFRDWLAGPFRSVYVSSGLGGLATDGVLAEYVVLPESSVVAIPKHLSFAEAACLPCAAVTAWNGLIVRAGLKAGDSLLVQGTGGVALFGLQFAVALGAEVIVLSSSDEKLEKAKALGASVLINYRQRPDWDVEVMGATSGPWRDSHLGTRRPRHLRSFDTVGSHRRNYRSGRRTFGLRPNASPPTLDVGKRQHHGSNGRLSRTSRDRRLIHHRARTTSCDRFHLRVR